MRPHRRHGGSEPQRAERRPDRWRDRPAPSAEQEEDGLFEALAEAVEREV